MPDIYVAKHEMDGIMSNDKIEVMVRKDGTRFRGDVVRVLDRAINKVTGQLTKINSSQGVLKDESFAWGEDLKVSWSPQVKPNDKDWVLVQITSYPDSVRGFQGQVIEVLGELSDPKNDNIRVLTAQGIPYKFSKETLREADALPEEVTERDIQGRVDLRNKKLVTIDGRTAKDFDDAIYIEKSKAGFRLWVAIADVSHYVNAGTSLDKEAYDRGNSTYFPHFVAPMLPEKISNELCSLKPNVDRLAFVCEMEINFNGDIVKSKVYEAVIKSHARITYGEAQEIIDKNTPEQFRHVEKEILLASELAHILMDKRYRDGSLNLEIPETTVELDEAGIPVDIIRAERIFAHKLIEEMMLAANVAVARFLDENKVPALYRVHEPPKPEALEILNTYLETFGGRGRLRGNNLQEKITSALKEFSGRPEETVLNILALRSMNQAKYSPDNVGHFGLGFSHYAHFTSPIRRYPDLIVHRLCKSVLRVHSKYKKMSNEDLEGSGVWLSACEQRSVKGERMVVSIKKARFLEKFLGQEMDGVISSVAKFGFFVLLRQFDVDGLVRVEELGGDRFEFDEETLTLRARKSGVSYSVGDSVRVQVAATDIQTGRIDFIPPSEAENKNASKKKGKSSKKRRSSEKDSDGVRAARVSGSGGKNRSEQGRPRRKNRPRRRK